MADLSQFNFSRMQNLKDLDVNKVLQLVSEHKVKALTAGFAATAIIGALMVFGDYRTQAAQYQQQMAQLQEKMDVISRHERSVKALKGFLDALPQELEDEKMITQLTDYAAQNNVEIINYAPGQKKSDRSYDSSRVHLNVNAGNFKDVLAFVRTVERSPYFLRVESFVGSSKDDNGAGGGRLTAEIFISSVRVKK